MPTHTHTHTHTFLKESKIRGMIHQPDSMAISRSLYKSSRTPHLYSFKMQILCALCFSVGLAYLSFCCFCASLGLFLLLYLFCLGLVSFSHFGIEKRRGLECSLTVAIVSGAVIGGFTCIICLNSHSKL